MPPKDESMLPFVTRKMLNFENGTQFQLHINHVSAVASTPVNIRGATKEGIFNFTFLTATAHTTGTTRFPIPDVPIWLMATSDNGTFALGDCFITISIQASGTRILPLCQGYVGGQHPLGWPSTNLDKPRSGPGKISFQVSADPAAGAVPSLTLNAREQQRLIGARVTLVTDATAANRRVHFIRNSGITWIMDFPSSVDQAASTTRKYTIASAFGAGTFSDDDDILIVIPDNLLLDAEEELTLSCTNLQAGDNFGVMSVWTEMWQV